MFSPRFVILVLLYGFISPMVVHGKKLHSDEISTPEVVQTTTPSHNETSALETVEKMAIEAKDFVVEGASSLVHKVGELVRQAVQSLQEFMKSDDNSVTNSTVVEEKETPSTTKKATKKKSKKSFTTTTIPEEDEDED